MAKQRPVYERVIFLQGEPASVALAILDDEGEEACLAFCQQWHYPGEHETCGYSSAGLLDDTYKADGYVLTYNTALGYVGLEYKVS